MVARGVPRQQLAGCGKKRELRFASKPSNLLLPLIARLGNGVRKGELWQQASRGGGRLWGLSGLWPDDATGRAALQVPPGVGRVHARSF